MQTQTQLSETNVAENQSLIQESERQVQQMLEQQRNNNKKVYVRKQYSFKILMKISFIIYITFNFVFLLYNRYAYTYNGNYIHIHNVNDVLDSDASFKIIAQQQYEIYREKLLASQQIIELIVDVFLQNYAIQEVNKTIATNSLKFLNHRNNNWKICRIDNITLCTEEKKEWQIYGVDQSFNFSTYVYHSYQQQLTQNAYRYLLNMNFMNEVMINYMQTYDMEVDNFYQFFFLFDDSQVVINYPVTPAKITDQIDQSIFTNQTGWYQKTKKLKQGQFYFELQNQKPYLVMLATPIYYNDKVIGVAAIEIITYLLAKTEQKNKMKLCKNWDNYLFDDSGRTFHIDMMNNTYDSLNHIYEYRMVNIEQKDNHIFKRVPYQVCQIIQNQFDNTHNLKQQSCQQKLDQSKKYFAQFQKMDVRLESSNMYLASFCENVDQKTQNMQDLVYQFFYIFIAYLCAWIFVLQKIMFRKINTVIRDFINPINQIKDKINKINQKFYSTPHVSNIYQNDIILQDETQLNIVLDNFNKQYDRLIQKNLIAKEQGDTEESILNKNIKFKNKQYSNYYEEINKIIDKIENSKNE